jgi:AcrR family transcriptional regulator
VTAHTLFCRYGMRGVGIDRIVDEANVAKRTLYRQFHSKEELVVAVLERREALWTRGWLERELEQRGGTAEERLLGIFDLFDEWFRRDDYESCLFINTLLQSEDPQSPIAAASARGLANIRAFVRGLAEEAGIDDPDGFALQWQILMSGSIIAADQGGLDAAQRARESAQLLLEREVG